MALYKAPGAASKPAVTHAAVQWRNPANSRIHDHGQRNCDSRPATDASSVRGRIATGRCWSYCDCDWNSAISTLEPCRAWSTGIVDLSEGANKCAGRIDFGTSYITTRMSFEPRRDHLNGGVLFVTEGSLNSLQRRLLAPDVPFSSCH